MKPVGGGQPVIQNQAVGSTAVAEPKKETEQVSNNSEAPKNSVETANAMKGEMGFNGQAQAAAVAERFHSTQMNPNQPVDLSNKELRNDMLRNAPQINPIAGEKGPHGLVSSMPIGNFLLPAAKKRFGKPVRQNSAG